MPGFEKKLNLDALQSYLSFEYVVPPQTLFEGVEALMPAHYLWVSADGSVDVHRYWDPQFEPDESMTEGEAVDLIDKTFLESVDAHRIADVEVGCFLSSGVDSSWVASNFAGQKAFTVGFGETSATTRSATRRPSRKRSASSTTRRSSRPRNTGTQSRRCSTT